MEDKKPIDRKRDSGGMADIGSEADGAIIEMFKFDGSLLIIKERSIYEFILADKIDPQRQNFNLPATIQRLALSRGTESELVCRTFLTAKRLYKDHYIVSTIDCKKALKLSLELTKELVALDNEIIDYLNEAKRVSTDYNAQEEKKGSYAIPSIPDIETRCKTIFQKADHVTQTLMEIVTLFYPHEKLNKQSHFPKLLEVLKSKYGDNDEFTKFISDSVKFLELVRSLRNCLDHRLLNVKVKDFELQLNSDVLSPTIEIDYRESKLERTDLEHFLFTVMTNLMTVSEAVIAYLADKGTKEPKGIPNYVKLIPEDLRINKFIQFSFWSPIGDGGFFDQQ
jgi:hypothetical protein